MGGEFFMIITSLTFLFAAFRHTFACLEDRRMKITVARLPTKFHQINCGVVGFYLFP